MESPKSTEKSETTCTTVKRLPRVRRIAQSIIRAAAAGANRNVKVIRMTYNATVPKSRLARTIGLLRQGDRKPDRMN